MTPIFRIAALLAPALAILTAVGIGAYQLFGIWIAFVAIATTTWALMRIVREAMIFGGFFEHQRQQMEGDFVPFSAEEQEINSKVEDAADVVTDPDLQEAFHHFVHLAEGCPGARNHLERLQVVLEHLQMRLTASPMKPMSAEERPTVH